MTGMRARGFTLLELIVVIGIFAIFAALAYGGLDSVLNTRVNIERGLTRTEDYDRAYLRMRNDFENASSRPIRSAQGELLPAFFYDTYTHSVELTRGGWQNLLNLPRATLERVSYFLDDSQPDGRRSGQRFEAKRLVRRSWYVLDRAPQTKPVDLVLLENVEQLNWRFLDDSRNWLEEWGGGSNNGFGAQNTSATLPAPRAIEIKLRTTDWGDLKFLFSVGAEGANQIAKLLATPQAPNGNGSGNTTGNTTGGQPGDTNGGNKQPPVPDPNEAQ